ncbi:aldo/keto reductase [Salininema proteolyticum]|uniref:Aldo/keto reductase n=1 Tax=Salininema proteolyticum TaxID=1607685 RepID=A0ABV8TTF5_9ACTN
METRRLGRSGLFVPVLGLGTATFAGKNDFFKEWGDTDVQGARRMIDISLDAGANLFDSADVYSDGAAEEVLGEALKGRRDRAIVSTKGGLPFVSDPADAGSSRRWLTKAVEGSLRRLRTDHIDLYQLHAFDAFTPVEETLETLDSFVRQGKIRYIGVSNYAGWQLMRMIGTAENRGLVRPVANQAYYSLIGRDFEWELMPLGLDQEMGTLVWSPLGWGRLTGAVRRDAPLPETSRLHRTADMSPHVDQERLYDVVDVLLEVAEEAGKSVPQVAINWLTGRPTVAGVMIGARTERQLRDNLGAVGWSLTADQIGRLDEASASQAPYPASVYSIQDGFRRVSPPLFG